MSTNCPVCGYDLGFEPWEGDASSDEICPSCGIQFGYDDVPEGGGLQGTREEIYAQWRSTWIEQGMPWFSVGRPPPHAWNPQQQLELLMVVLDYELLHYENRQTQELDLSTVDSMTILYDPFLGDIIFWVDGTDMSARWGWVPILDFAVGLYTVIEKLKDSESEVFEFTESEAAIDFTFVNGYVKIEPNYAPSNRTSENPISRKLGE